MVKLLKTGKKSPSSKKAEQKSLTVARPVKPIKRVRGSSLAPTNPARVRTILDRFAAHYPKAVCALHHKNAWELMIATILSAQCTDVRVNLVTPELFRRFPTPQTLTKGTPEEIEELIRTTGFFRNKTKNILGAAKRVVEEFGGKVPQTMEEILTIPGVARKTGNVVLGSWYKLAVGVVVDTHVMRITQRLELTRSTTPEKIEQDMMQLIPQESWIDFSHRVIYFGREICIARKPRCADCFLEDICNSKGKTWSTH